MEFNLKNVVFNVKFSDESVLDIELKSYYYFNKQVVMQFYKIFTYYDDNIYFADYATPDLYSPCHICDHQIEALPSIFNSEKRCFQLYYLNKNDNSHHCIELHYFDDKFDIFGKYFRENTEIVLK